MSALSNMFYMVLHVNSSNSFPKPLSAADERKWLQRLKDGDSEARNVLVEHNLRLVAHIIKKYYSSTNDQDDLVSIGTIGLIKAINTFNVDKGIRLSSYAARCIENEILMYFRASKKTAQDVYMNEPIDSDNDGNELTLMDIIADNTSIFDDLDLKLNTQKLKRFLTENLDERERTIIELRYGLRGAEPLTQREVAQKLDISRSYVSRIEKKSLESLRICFEQPDKRIG